MHRKVALASLALLSGLILALAILVVPSGPASPVKADPTVLYVALGGDCGEASPCHATIQAAVDAAATGAMIKVASGVYTDVHVRSRHDVTTTGLVTQVAYVSKTVTIQGGYTTANWMMSDPDANPTTLDAQGQGRVVYVTGNISPTIESFRLTGGSADGLGGTLGGDAGGGVYVITATAVLSNNKVFANTASKAGGVMIYYSEGTLIGNSITSNTADYIGGVLVSMGDAKVIDNTIAANIATDASCGGLYLHWSDALVAGNTIISNTTGKDGGGMDIVSSDATLVNNIIAGNQSGATGSGLRIWASSPRLVHTTIAHNSGGDGSAVYISGHSGVDSSVTLTNTIVAGHELGVHAESGSIAVMEATLWHANVTDQQGNVVHSNDRSGDPVFVDPEAGDYHIERGSAAFNAGVDAGVAYDVDGDPRVDGHPDIGADELVVGLNVTKQADPDPVEPSEQLTYTICITNTGSVDLHATITDTLPLSVTLDKAFGGTLVLPGGTLAPPDGTVILPDGRVAVTWTAVITPPGGLWLGTLLVSVDEGYVGPLTNLVEVTTEEGAAGAYTETSTSIVLYPVYLPLVLKYASGPITVEGEYLLVGNPCNTDPCLPGMVYAVLADDTYYYLTVEGAWLWSNHSWDGYTPEIGDFVTVTGYVNEEVDVFGTPFYNIEVTSLQPTLPPPTTTFHVVITDVHAYGTGDQEPDEYVEIRNDGTQSVQLNGWTLHNAENYQGFTFPNHVMQPGQVCRVYTNEDHPDWCGFSYGSESDVWRYANGCAYLRDSEGTLVNAYCYCQSHTAYMTISTTATTLQVGEVVTATVTLFDRGCTGLGMPQYRLYIWSDEPEPIFLPSNPGPVVHYLMVAPGQSDATEFILQAIEPGQATFSASASFEVHLGYPGPAYWGYSGAGPLAITVMP